MKQFQHRTPGKGPDDASLWGQQPLCLPTWLRAIGRVLTLCIAQKTTTLTLTGVPGNSDTTTFTSEAYSAYIRDSQYVHASGSFSYYDPADIQSWLRGGRLGDSMNEPNQSLKPFSFWNVNVCNNFQKKKHGRHKNFSMPILHDRPDWYLSPSDLEVVKVERSRRSTHRPVNLVPQQPFSELDYIIVSESGSWASIVTRNLIVSNDGLSAWIHDVGRGEGGSKKGDGPAAVNPEEISRRERKAKALADSIASQPPTNAVAFKHYGVRKFKIKHRVRAYGPNVDLKCRDYAYLRAFPSEYFRWMQSAPRDVQLDVLARVLRAWRCHNTPPCLCEESRKECGQDEICKTSGEAKNPGPKGGKMKGKGQPKPKKQQKLKKKQHKKNQPKKNRQKHPKKFDSATTRTGRADKSYHIVPKFSDKTLFSASTVLEQAVLLSTTAPSILYSFVVSYINAATAQDLNNKSQNPGSIAANVGNYKWFSPEKLETIIEPDLGNMANGKFLLVSSPDPLNESNIRGFLQNRRSPTGWLDGVREISSQDFEGGGVKRFNLDFIEGARPIVPKNDDPGACVLTYFYIVQWNLIQTVPLGGTGSSSSTIMQSPVGGPFSTVSLYLNGHLIYKCGGLGRPDGTVVRRETEILQSPAMSVGSFRYYDHNYGGAPQAYTATPSLLEQINNGLTMFGAKAVSPVPLVGETLPGLDNGGSTYSEYTDSNTGEIFTSLFTTIVTVTAAVLTGGMLAPIEPAICQIVATGTALIVEMVSRWVGNTSTVKQKTIAFDNANQSTSGPPVGTSALMGAPTTNFNTNVGYASIPINTIVQGLMDKGETLPAASPAGQLTRISHGNIFEGGYPTWKVSNDSPVPASTSLEADFFEMDNGGLDAIYPTTIQSWTDPGSAQAGIPYAVSYTGLDSIRPLTLVNTQGKYYTQSSDRYRERYLWWGDADYTVGAVNSQVRVPLFVYPDPNSNFFSADPGLTDPEIWTPLDYPAFDSEEDAIQWVSVFLNSEPEYWVSDIYWTVDFTYRRIFCNPTPNSFNPYAVDAPDGTGFSSWVSCVSTDDNFVCSMGHLKGSFSVGRGTYNSLKWWESFGTFIHFMTFDFHEASTRIASTGTTLHLRPFKEGDFSTSASVYHIMPRF